MSDLAGRTLGKYRVVARLGRGGMAEVYKAYQPGLDRYVAVKVMHSHLSEESDFVGRFKREAAAVANLRHSNIVQVYDFDVEEDLYYMVMEYVEGPTLKAELKERSMSGQIFSLSETSRIFSALASAIDYAHSRGMVHRDLKPANIMFTNEGQVVLTDFGIARIMGATRYTMTGAISGTPAYMSPEQGQGGRGDERSDIYSLGVILYEMVVGTVPFDADTPFAIIMKHINDPLPMPRVLNPNIPEGVERIVLKALSKNPDDRFQTAGEMAKALRQAVGVTADETLASSPVVTIAPAPRVQEMPVQPSAAGTAAHAGAAGATVSSGQGATAAVPGAERPKTIAGIPAVPFAIAAGLIAVICLAAVAVVGTQMLSSKVDTQATQTAVAIGLMVTDTPTAAPTDTPVPADTSTTAPTPTERVVVVTSTPLPATDTPVPPPPTYTPLPPQATYTPPPTYTPYPTPTSLPSDTPSPVPPPTATAERVETTPVTAGGEDEEGSEETSVPAQTAISGRLAVPVDDGAGYYDVVIYSIPDGQVVGKVSKARQPNFRADGALAVNGEGGASENIWEYQSDGGGGREVSSSPQDGHPFWKPDGSGIVYDNPELVCAKSACPEYHIFVQAGTNKPETRTVADSYILDGDIFRDQPMYPLWASDDYIIFRGCDIWQGGSGGGTCGIWRTPSWATHKGTGFTVPARLTNADEIPTDAKGSRLVYMGRQEGNWEVYVTGITGGPGTNLSNSPANDGLATISPDGESVAFVSDRDGKWGVWVVPITGGTPVRLPIDISRWGSGNRDWITERISWGP